MATRLPHPGSDDGIWGTILNEFLAQAHNPDGTLKQLEQSQVKDLVADLANKVNAATYTTGLAGKADLTAGRVPEAQLPDRLSDASLRTAFVTPDELPGALPDATMTVKGIVELATSAETTAGTDSDRAVTPIGLKAVTDAMAVVPVNFFVENQVLATWMMGRHMQAENDGPVTVQVPHNSLFNFPIGAQIDIGQGNVGEVSFTTAPGVNLSSRGGARKLAGRFAIATVRKIGDNHWWLFGDIVA